MKTKKFYLNLSSSIIKDIIIFFPHLKITFSYKKEKYCLLKISCSNYPIFTSNLIEFIRSCGYEYYVSLTTKTLNIDLTQKL